MKALILGLFASAALGAEPVVCTLTTSTSAAASTASCTTGSATWSAGGAVLMQCTTDVYVSTTTTTGSLAAATSSSEMVEFTTNKDKVAFWLNPGDKHVSVLAVSSAGTCKFMTTLRKRP